jgi:FixJ family two-component response regulator
MPDANATVLVIDDDSALRASIGRLLRSLGLDARLFASISEFLESDRPDGPTCLVLDVRLPGQSGLDLQRELAATNREIPIIFITGYGDIPMSVQAMKGGDIEFLTKSFRDQDLLDAVAAALERDRKRRTDEKVVGDLQALVDALTPRERQVMTLVTAGMMNKQSAHDLGVQRDHGENSPRQTDEEDGRPIAGGSGADGGHSRPPAHEGPRELILLSQKVAFWEPGILDNLGRFVFRHEELRWITR